MGYIMSIIKDNRDRESNLIIICNDGVSSGYVDLDSRDIMINYIKTKLGMAIHKKYTKKFELIKNLDNKTYERFIKESLVLKKWKIELLETKDEIFSLFDTYTKSKEEFISSYLSCSYKFGAAYSLASLLTFLEKAAKYKDIKQDMRGRYRKSVRKASGRMKKPKDFANNLIHLNSEIPLELKVILAYLQ